MNDPIIQRIECFRCSKGTERRYAACDPDNRLIAATLEKNWETALRRVSDCQARLDATMISAPTPVGPELSALAGDLEAAWKNSRVTMRCRQQLVRARFNEIIVDIDQAAREIVLVIHWKGGQHSELRLTGEHACCTSDDAPGGRAPDGGPLVRPEYRRPAQPDGFADEPTQDLDRSSSSLVRGARDIHAYKSAEKDGTWLTLREAA